MDDRENKFDLPPKNNISHSKENTPLGEDVVGFFTEHIGKVVFGIMSTVVIAGGVQFYQHKSKSIREKQHQILAAIGQLKSGQIQDWCKERLSDAQRVATGPFVKRRVEEFLNNPNSQIALNDLCMQLQLAKDSYNYDSASLLALDGKTLLSTYDITDQNKQIVSETISKAIVTHNAVFSQFFKNDKGDTCLDIMAAIRNNKEQPIAIISLTSNANYFLFPLVQNWPLPNYSAETALILRSDDEAHVPHKLRHQKEGTPLWNQPLSRTEFPAVQAVLGKQGLFEGIDYQKKAIIADLQSIPDSPWFMVSKMDTEEALIELRKDTLFIVGITIAFILLSGAGVIIFNKQHENKKLKDEQEKTKEGELRLKEVLENSWSVSYNRNLKTGVYDYISPVLLELSGYTMEEMNSFSIITRLHLVHPDDIEEHERMVTKALSDTNGARYELEYRFLHKDGKYRWFRDQFKIKRNASGENLAIVGSLSDISERKNAEMDLRKHKELLTAVGRIAKVGGWEIDLIEGSKLTWTDQLHIIHEVDSDFIPTLDGAIGFYTPESQPIISEAVSRAVQYGESFDVELQIITAQGNMRWVEAKGNPVFLNSKVIRVEGVFQDITERKNAEEVMQERNRFIESLININPDTIYIYDLVDGKNIFTNKGIEIALGYSVEEIQAMGNQVLSILMHPDDMKVYRQETLQSYSAAKDGERILHIFRMKNKNGDWEWLDCTEVVYSRNENGSPRQIFGIIRNITENRKVEEERQRLQAQLQQSQKMESIGTLASGVAHDMNNVLGAILGLASIHEETQPVGSASQRAFSTIMKAANRGGEMVKSLLNFARQTPASEQVLDINTILREEVNLLRTTTLSKVKLELELAPDLQTIRGDSGTLASVFMNLCVNAVDAMSEKGILTLRTRNVDRDWIEIEVEDNGVGMLKETLEKAMDPFFTTKETGKGTGLGLSMAYNVVRSHNGGIDIQSEIGKGTCVRIRFPTYIEPIHTAQKPVSNTIIDNKVEKIDALNVLLVDDDELIQGSLQAMLDILGNTYEAVSTGEEALEKLGAGFQPDVIILDMNMPGMGGVGALPRIRSLHPNVPILLATGRADETAINLTRSHPYVTLLPKPFGFQEIQERLNIVKQTRDTNRSNGIENT